MAGGRPRRLSVARAAGCPMADGRSADRQRRTRVRGVRRRHAAVGRGRAVGQRNGVHVQRVRGGDQRGRAAGRVGRGRVRVHRVRSPEATRAASRPGAVVRLVARVRRGQLRHARAVDRGPVVLGGRRPRPVHRRMDAVLLPDGRVRLRGQRVLLVVVRLLPDDRVLRAASPIQRRVRRLRDARPRPRELAAVVAVASDRSVRCRTRSPNTVPLAGYPASYLRPSLFFCRCSRGRRSYDDRERLRRVDQSRGRQSKRDWVS